MTSSFTSSYSETVESIVDRYLNDWGYTFDQTYHEIRHNFSMEPEEITRTLAHLEYRHRRRNVGNARAVADYDPEDQLP